MLATAPLRSKQTTLDGSCEPQVTTTTQSPTTVCTKTYPGGNCIPGGMPGGGMGGIIPGGGMKPGGAIIGTIPGAIWSSVRAFLAAGSSPPPRSIRCRGKLHQPVLAEEH
jgi:hypothetical protein